MWKGGGAIAAEYHAGLLPTKATTYTSTGEAKAAFRPAIGVLKNLDAPERLALSAALHVLTARDLRACFDMDGEPIGDGK